MTTHPLSLERQLELTIERRQEDAARILAHYAALDRDVHSTVEAIALRSDATAKMRVVVQAIVDAASLTVQRNKLGWQVTEHQQSLWKERLAKHDGHEVVEITPKGRDALEEEGEYDHRMEFGMAYDHSDSGEEGA